MRYKYIRLQELYQVAANEAQPVWQAIDIGGFKTLVVMKRTAVAAATSGTLGLQHSALNDEASFVDVGSGDWDLTIAGNAVYTHTNLLRYVRWRVWNLNAGAQFLLDAIAKEN